MLTSVRLQNFQSHKDTELELGKLTMFTGGSNSGKSAALRGIIGLLKNEPAANYVTWDGSKNVEVTFTFEDGGVVKWIKGKDNDYVVTTPQGEEAKFQKVGAGVVPEEVAEVLGLTPLVLEDGTKVHVNVHTQLESPFLVSQTNGFVAKVLGELTSASKIFSAASEGNRRIREKNARKKVRREDLTAVRASLQEYDGLDEKLALLAEVEELDKTSLGLTRKYLALVELRKNHQHAETLIEDARRKLTALQPLVELDLGSLTESAARIARLTALRDAHAAVEVKVGKLQRLEGPLLAAANVTGLDEAMTVGRKADALRELVRKHEIVSYDLGNVREKWTKLQTAAVKIERALTTAYGELTACPSCGQELSGDDAKDHLLKEVA